MNHLAALLLLTISIRGFAQESQSNGEKGTPIILHVTSVHQQDLTDCDPNKCSSKKLTVEGYSDNTRTNARVVYVLNCVESVVYEPTPHYSGTCVRLHADGDYEGKRFADSISFWPEEKYTPPPYRVLYSIVSESEVRKPR